MKKALLSIAIVFSCSSIFAQISKGQYMVGGNFSFNYVGDFDGANVYTFNGTPKVGFFFMDKLAGGVALSLNSRKNSGNGTTVSNSFGYSISPYVRYYVLPESSRFNLFGEASYGWGQSTYKFLLEDKSKYKTESFSFAAGSVFFVTPNVGIELNVGYFHNTLRDNVPNSGKFTSKGIQTGIGLQIHLGKRKK